MSEITRDNVHLLLWVHIVIKYAPGVCNQNFAYAIASLPAIFLLRYSFYQPIFRRKGLFLGFLDAVQHRVAFGERDADMVGIVFGHILAAIGF